MTIKLSDAPAARELVLTACPVADPVARAGIERSFAAVWNLAAGPYAPITDVPGIVWTPVVVTVEQIMSRSR